MSTEQIVRIVAGMFVMLSVALGYSDSPIFHHSYWLLLAAFVGLNLFQSGFTKFCPLELILKKAGVRSCC